MLSLDHKLVLDQSAIDSTNLCEKFSDEDLAKLGNWVCDGYKQDRQSRQTWEKRTSAAMDLALQMTKDKNFPWPNCSNVAFPLVTIAALQCHARAYPTLVSGTDVVKCRVIGEDPDGTQTARATRISCHMSYQVLEEDQAWEEQHDRLLLNVPIVGVAFKKSYFSARENHNVSDLVLAQDLVMDYYAKSTESCPRKTHHIPLRRNEIYERVKRGTFRDVLEENWYLGMPQIKTGVQESERNRRSGQNTPPKADETTPFQCLEQHVSVDLDKDGYAEPYIITIEEDSKCVLRIVTRFDQESAIQRNEADEIVCISPVEYFTKYGFIPSPDGSIYDIGFGLFLGPLNESVNSIFNQLIDAGTMATTAGGFLGKGAKIRGGVYTFSPFGWNRVDSSGDDLRKNVVPFEVREPSAVLFQLLTLLINYSNRISGSTEMLVGENPGQNTPAETSRTMVEQGMKVYNAIFKRMWRCMKEEFKKLYILNGIFMPIKKPYGVGQYAQRSDYLGDPNRVVPAADPNVTSDTQSIQIAGTVKQAAAVTPGYNKDEAERRFLKALKIDAIDVLFPGTEGQEPPKDVKVVIAEMNIQHKMAVLQQSQLEFVHNLQEEQRLDTAKIAALEAEATARLLDVQGDVQDRQIAVINAQLGMLKEHTAARMKHIDLAIKGLDYEKARIEHHTARVDAMAQRSSNAGA